MMHVVFSSHFNQVVSLVSKQLIGFPIPPVNRAGKKHKTTSNWTQMAQCKMSHFNPWLTPASTRCDQECCGGGASREDVEVKISRTANSYQWK